MDKSTIECNGTQDWAKLGKISRLKQDLNAETNFWKKANILKKLCLLESDLNTNSDMKLRLRSYQSGFPDTHPLQIKFTKALILLESNEKSLESNEKLSQAS